MPSPTQIKERARKEQRVAALGARNAMRHDGPEWSEEAIIELWPTEASVLRAMLRVAIANPDLVNDQLDDLATHHLAHGHATVEQACRAIATTFAESELLQNGYEGRIPMMQPTDALDFLPAFQQRKPWLKYDAEGNLEVLK